MPSPFIVAFYWGNRPSAPSESASLLLPAFDALREEGFDQFFRKARTRKAANASPFLPTQESLTELLAAGINRRDIARQAIPELGQRLGLWSGETDDEVYSLSVNVGGTASVGKNNFILHLPVLGPNALPSATQRVQSLFARLVPILHPLQAIVCEADAIQWDKERLAASIPCVVRYDSAA